MGKEKDCCIGRCTLKFNVTFDCDPEHIKPMGSCTYTGYMSRTLRSICLDIRCEGETDQPRGIAPKSCETFAHPPSLSPCRDQVIEPNPGPTGSMGGVGEIVRCIVLPCCTDPCNDRIKKEKYEIMGVVVKDTTRDMLQAVMDDVMEEYGIGGTQPPTFQKCCPPEPKVGDH